MKVVTVMSPLGFVEAWIWVYSSATVLAFLESQTGRVKPG